MKLLWVLLLLGSFANAEEIEEAQGLAEDLQASLQAAVKNSSDNFDHRIYFLTEGIQQKAGSQSILNYTNFETSFSATYKTNAASFFVDGVVNSNDSAHSLDAFLNQIGIRYQADDHWNFALGKERNRRSPGILVSPSDILFTQSNLPGQREDRRGVWSGRVSYQQAKSSYDVFFLPVDSQDVGGWPASDKKYFGTVGRTLQQFENIDVSLMAGDIGGVNKAGLALQGIIANVWKTYYEVGYTAKATSLLGQEITKISQHLVGVSYEGNEDYGFKLEYFQNGQGLNAADYEQFKTVVLMSPSLQTFTSPFLRRQYGIFTMSAIEMDNRYNAFLSVVKSFEDGSYLSFVRAEALVNDHMVAGLSSQFLSTHRDTQYFVSRFDQQFSVDLKYTF